MSLRDLGTWFASLFEGYGSVFLWQTNWLDVPIFTLFFVVVNYFFIFAGLTYLVSVLLVILFDWFVHRKKLRQDGEYKSEWFGKPWRVRHPRVFRLILFVLFWVILMFFAIIADTIETFL